MPPFNRIVNCTSRLIARTVLVGGPALLLSSCLTYYPNLIKTPLLTHGGEAHGAAYLTKSGVDVFAGYAIGDHTALVASASGGFDNQSTSTDTHIYGELGIGTFGTPAPHWTSEAFVGGGFGQSYTLLAQTDNPVIKGNYARGYLMSDLAWTIGGIDIGAAVRLAAVDFVTGDPQNPFGLYIEPAGFVRYGWQRVKIEGQIGGSWHIFSDPSFGQQKLFCGIGLHVVLPRLDE